MSEVIPWKLEDLAALLDGDVHDKAGIRDHPIVDERIETRVVFSQLPQWFTMRQLEDAGVRKLLLEPRAKLEVGGDNVGTE